MPSDLLRKQFLFTHLLSYLIQFAYSKGWKLTLGEGFRGDSKGHMPGSLHYSRLAQDLNLFVDDQWIQVAHPAWTELGEYWEGLDPDCAWGGRFANQDYNHFSLSHGGKK